MEKMKTDVPYPYITIRVTKSRIDKGLLAIPVSLTYLFPKEKTEIYILDENGNEETKSFTPYKSSSRECRIGGMSEFYEKYNVQKGDEIVIQIIGNRRYRLIPEKKFRHDIQNFENKIEETNDEKNLEKLIREFTDFLNTKSEDIMKREFLRLSIRKVGKRKTSRKIQSSRETVPPFVRKILLEIYHGKCQVSGFTFLMKNGNPYFEVHHINPELGHHPKNLLVVSPNVHAQFTYAYVKHFFDSEGWLRKVKFNDKVYEVHQAIEEIPAGYVKEVHI